MFVDRPQSLFSFVPQESHSQAGLAKCLPTSISAYIHICSASVQMCASLKRDCVIMIVKNTKSVPTFQCLICEASISICNCCGCGPLHVCEWVGGNGAEAKLEKVPWQIFITSVLTFPWRDCIYANIYNMQNRYITYMIYLCCKTISLQIHVQFFFSISCPETQARTDFNYSDGQPFLHIPVRASLHQPMFSMIIQSTWQTINQNDIAVESPHANLEPRLLHPRDCNFCYQ